eukprot:TRINITY_DN20723_c0_g1::TRINITY_DN20723_c0_g1_i1::g.9100::m.9100 TRINITY_DN20723_c0_g1::TRINITY_DN20723_c0_g1_i1::g.9100  ORF type:complete len:265 (-),score=75.52,sp/P45693/SP5S_BACSU/37.21/6e-06,SpoVS/PF04232.7/5.8e-17,SpoVS/PF04232.7/5.4e-19 TRINITY_DN20723_c0_g1_i1:54-800(-)
MEAQNQEATTNNRARVRRGGAPRRGGATRGGARGNSNPTRQQNPAPPRKQAAPRNNADTNSSDKIKVGRDTPPRALAGLIATLARQGQNRNLVAVGGFATNQAVKAIAIARNYVANDENKEVKEDLAFKPSFTRLEDLSEGSTGIEFHVEKTTLVATGPPAELKVSKSTVVKALAGAIANKVRDGFSVVINGVGPLAVNQAIKSVALARRYLTRDNIELLAQPEFIGVSVVPGNISTGIQLSVLPVKM